MNIKERPILFSGPMIRAILEGRKTQTRRVVKPKPNAGLNGEPYWNIGGLRWRPYGQPSVSNNPIACKYGHPGDRLWVKETFMIPDGNRHLITYRSDEPKTSDLKWKPSLFMRREYSRITLEITGTRVERLQDISEEDAKAEGASNEIPCGWITGTKNKVCRVTYEGTFRQGYELLWESINGAGSWAANPWVWVVEFKKI